MPCATSFTSAPSISQILAISLMKLMRVARNAFEAYLIISAVRKSVITIGARRGKCSCANDQVDRKSTRLNSSHQIISYAVFCLKKKNANHVNTHHITTGPPFATKRKATTLDTELNMYIAYYTTPHPHLTHT